MTWDAAYKEEYDGLVDIETWETKNGSIIPRTQKVRKRGDENPQKKKTLSTLLSHLELFLCTRTDSNTSVLMMIENEVLIQRKEYQNHPTIFMATEINDDDRLLLLFDYYYNMILHLLMQVRLIAASKTGNNAKTKPR